MSSSAVTEALAPSPGRRHAESLRASGAAVRWIPRPRARRAALLAAATVGLIVGSFRPAAAEPASVGLDRAAVARLIRGAVPRVVDAQGWAGDLLGVLDDLRYEASPDNVCAVIAIVRQESGFAANPHVPGLGAMARKAAETEITGSLKYSAYFSAHPWVRSTFLARLGRAGTERDLDLAYRWLSGVVRGDWAFATYMRLAKSDTSPAAYLEANNKIRTIGAMQVSVRFAAQTTSIALTDPDYQRKLYRLRDLMYTRRGGLRYGTMQLLGYRADYPSRLYLFADYNSGRYSSRNAAVQAWVAALSGAALHLDGDLLAYAGDAVQGTSETETAINGLLTQRGIGDPARVRDDLLREKTRGFAGTWTYRTLQTLYEQRTGRTAPYAIVPRIALDSVKMKHRMTTAIFARSVERHYRACVALAGEPRETAAVPSPPFTAWGPTGITPPSPIP